MSSRFFQASDIADQRIRGLVHHLFFNRFHLKLLSVVLRPDKGDYPENSYVVFCPNK